MIMGKKMSLAALVGVTVALFAGTITPSGAVCSNGLEGVQSTSDDVCCVDGCGVCGGTGCTPPANSSALTAADCCASEIIESGVFCETSGAAPCIVTTAAAPDDSVCINGQTGVQDPNTDVCCPLECGDFCGGDGCGSIPGVDGSQCCAAAIMASGAVCSDTVLPPCTVVASAGDNSTTCSNDLVGIEDPVNLICCDAACGQCGGAGCGNVPGLTGLECCSDEIEAAGELCSVKGAAPCVVDPPDFTPSMCPNGIAGVQDATVCCAEECNLVCGGVGCGSIVGTNGAADCCSNDILLAGVECDAALGVQAPCIMQNGTFTNAPAASPTIPPPAVAATLAPGAAANATLAPAATDAGAVTTAPTAGSRDIDFTQAPTIAGDTNGDGLLNSADTGVAGDTNGDGVVDGRDTGLVGDTNGDGVVNDLDEIVGGTTEAPTASPTPGAGATGTTGAPTGAPTASADGSRDLDVTPSPIREDLNGDGVIDSQDTLAPVTPAPVSDADDEDGAGGVGANTPAPLSDADAEASGNGAMSTAKLPAGVLGVAMTVGGMLLL